ncbi:MAG: phenylacetate--CoA ligase [Candidatus Rokubacteria bacterium]|nr:phenylacetate--CoA ligase [Candidatus Rokubacteria bacterium]
MFQPAEETRDRESLERLQLERLRATVARIAAHNPRYHRHLGTIAPRDIASLRDLEALPFLTKAELRDAYPYGMACVGPEPILRVHMSSGTTGAPIVNPYTPADVQQWREVMARCLTVATIGAQDVLQVTASFGLFTGGFGFHYGAEALGAMVVPIGAGRTLLQLQLIRDLGVTALAGIATYPLRLIEVARQEGFDFRKTRLRAAILGSEMWSDELRVRIEEAMGVRAYDLIGMTETGGPGMGVDCEARDGIHVWDDHYLPEVVDPATGAGLADGEPGELVVTTLTRQGLPLIRYRTHDLTRIHSRARCACGRTGVRVDRLRGRTDDMVIVKGVNFYPSQVERTLLRQRGFGHEYQILLEQDPGGGERMVLCVEVEPGCDAGAEERLRRELHDFLGLSPEIRRLAVGEIPRPQGKAVRVVDTRGTAPERTGT